ncbi:hypothetical protein ACB092_06G047300 [Castanea dentata]
MVWVGMLFFFLLFYISNHPCASLYVNFIDWFNFRGYPMYETFDGLGRVGCGKMIKASFKVLLRMLYNCLMKCPRGMYGQGFNGIWLFD